MKRTLQELQQLYIDTKGVVFKESIARSRIVEGEEYNFLAEQLQELARRQQALTKDIPDSSSILRQIEEEITEIFRDQKLSHFEHFKGKYRNKNKVNNGRLIGTLDLDTFITLAEVSQTKLREFAEDYKFSPLHREILDCIENTGKELVGVEWNYDAPSVKLEEWK
jgi:hypothetical protein